MTTRPDASVTDIAADWFARSERGLDAAEERELAEWLAADPRHETAFLAFEESWQRLGSMTPLAVVEPPQPRPAKTPAWRWAAGLAAAAAVAIAAVGGWRTWQRNYAPHEIAAQTEIGGLREIALPDGSVVRLNTDTRVHIAYTREARRVELQQGEAHFTVAKNPRRPFIVSVAGLDVRAVGTAFNVRMRDAAIEVLVTEGRVRLADANQAAKSLLPEGPPPELGTGERALVTLSSATNENADAHSVAPPVVMVVPEHVLRQQLAWQEKRLDFDATPLADMVEELNRYSRTKLVIHDPSLRGELFGGSFPAGDTATVVRMLVENFDVIAEQRKGEVVLRRRPHEN